MSGTKESFVVQVKSPGTRAYVDVSAGAGKATEDKAREVLAKASEKANGSGAVFRIVRRVTTFTHTDVPVKAAKSK